MEENKTVKKEEFEVDVRRIVGALMKKIWLIGAAALISAIIAFVYTFFFVTPLYKSSAMFYVNNGTISSLSNVAASITSGDISAAKDLVDSYIVILKTRDSLNEVIDYANLDRDYEELYDMVSAAAVNSTEIFAVEVTSPDPYEAEKIANAIAYILPKRISGIIEGSSAKIVEYAVVAPKPSSPSYVQNTAIGLIIGLIVCAGIIAVREMLDFTVREENDITQISKYPILTQVPDMTAPSKGGYYSKDSKKKKIATTQTALFGENISFAASEAYKLLRTKIQFSFADENDCHVICTTSALAGEGKSLSSVNLAYSLAQLDKKVILIDCDLRRPSIAAKIGISKAPGLSDYLTRHVHSDEIIQEIHVDSGMPFDVVAAGRIPPNPMELLSSARMEKIINKYHEDYDYIILDLPPIEEVGDALVAAKIADGVLLVVRQNYGNRLAVENTLKQLEFVNAKVLGIVFNATSESGGGKYYGYGKKYYGQAKYENSYEKSADRAKRDHESKREGGHARRAKTRDDD